MALHEKLKLKQNYELTLVCYFVLGRFGTHICVKQNRTYDI